MLNTKSVILTFAMLSSYPLMAQQKIDFMFPAPLDGKLTVEMTRIIKEFNQSQKEVEVRGIFTGNYDTTKVKAEAAAKAGSPPALVIMSANFTTDLAIKDSILPMKELFKFAEMGTQSDSKQDANPEIFLETNFWPALHKNAKFMETTYAIPFHNSTPILYYNQDMFKQAGLMPPSTWDELVKVAKQLTIHEKGQWGIMLPSTNNDYGGWILSSLVRANGGKYYNEDYPGQVYYDSNETKETLQFVQDLVYKYKVMPKGVLDNKQINTAFFSGKLGMAMLSTGALGFMRENAKDFELGVAMMPEKVIKGVTIGGASLVSFKGISESEKKAAYAFLMHLVSPKISGEWSRFTGYFAPRIAAYELPEMKNYIANDPRAKIALDQLQYAHPWYATYETVSVRKAMENQLGALLDNPKLKVNEAAENAQREADEIMKPYVALHPIVIKE